MDHLPDYRTRLGQQHLVMARIRAHGGASIFWLTENQKRAHAADRLVADGFIMRRKDDPRDSYPWCVFTVNEPPRPLKP